MTNFVKHVEGQAAAVDTAVYGREHSRQRMPLPEDYDAKRNYADLPKLFPQIARIFKGVLGSYTRYKFPAKASKSEASAAFIAELEQFARENGATAIGYARITPDLIFKDFVIPHQNAIVLISEMRKEPFITAPSVESMVEVAKLYADTTQIANQLSSYLRKHGFSAYSGVSIGGSVDHTRLAEKAGLGKIGYHGSLISPEHGARVRINVVYTNIENLPYPTSNEHDWVLDFCGMCHKCIRKCPPQAIRQDPEPDLDGRISAIDNTICGPFMAANHGCGVCIAVCPFSLAGYEKIQHGFVAAQAKRKLREMTVNERDIERN
ncbi:MAG: [Fe-S]-binding protein [Anaerolineae bacterium]|nr:[Fe-S]-binding protein [Anaerolineae bacterium]MCO5192549.1 [Fe-S]-binding protein [Anaerolineae bacterium]MCO5198726.1 [Fe-S]-binding protein [Anaerolineae bacterium]